MNNNSQKWGVSGKYTVIWNIRESMKLKTPAEIILGFQITYLYQWGEETCKDKNAPIHKIILIMRDPNWTSFIEQAFQIHKNSLRMRQLSYLIMPLFSHKNYAKKDILKLIIWSARI